MEICKGIKERYEIDFERVGIEENHVHVLCSGVPRYSPTRMITVIKSITAREIFRRFPEVRKELWEGNFGQMVIILLQ